MTGDHLCVVLALAYIVVNGMINTVLLFLWGSRGSPRSPVAPDRDSDQVVLVVIRDPDDLRVNPAPVVAPPRRLAVERPAVPTPAPPRWGNDRPVYRQVW
jgi:hypothetical protein